MIHLVFTGGTISMQHDPAAGGNVPAHGGEQLVALAPGLDRIAPFRIENWARVPAAHLGPERLWALRERVRELQEAPEGRDRPAGIVITHGTDTLEETAYLLARTLDPRVPVALTGAMRTSSDPDWDGPRNLRDAATVAASPDSAGRGAMVVFAGAIFAGNEAVKTDTMRLDAFSAPHGRPIGQVADGRVSYSAPARKTTPLAARGLGARVALVPMVIGDRGELLDLARPTHDGVVIEAFGSGNLPPGALPAIGRWLEQGKPVVLASRCATGVVTPAYAFEGGGAGLVKMGVTPAGPRTPSQARLELVLALSARVPYPVA
jgi:L-asparaginase